jgi:transcriptional regulator with XRE-family HTH domain
MTDKATPFPSQSLRRLRAVLALRGTTVAPTASKLGVTPSHFRVVLLGEREGSIALQSRLEAALTADEWAFVTGRVDVLTDVHAHAHAEDLGDGVADVRG